MATKDRVTALDRLRSVLGFLIGIFGALAILGVFFKIIKYEFLGIGWETFMVAGFIGEALAFVVMGIFELFGAFQRNKEVVVEDERAHMLAPEPLSQEQMNAVLRERMEEVADEVTASFRTMMQDLTRSYHQVLGESIRGDLDEIVSSMAQETQRFGDEMRALGEEMGRAQHAVHGMRGELDKVVTGDLANDAERLGSGMKRLGGEMEHAGSAVERIRADLDEMATRFRGFNSPHPSTNGVSDHKIRQVS